MTEIELKARVAADMSRRDFMVSAAAAAAAGLVLSESARGQEAGGAKGALQIAMIGVGSQGRNLLNNCLKITDVPLRFVAISDVWAYHQKYGANILKKYDQPVNVYADYREMLEKEPGIDAVIIASPDWVHAEQTIACLEAGKHVYCEKEMSNNLEGARAMVEAQRRTGKLVQIGHQRRSNPRYWHAIKLIEKDKVLGRITHIAGQWNRAVGRPIGWPRNQDIDAETLKRLGYDSMERFRNWRWYKKFAGGPFADLGSHQIDVFNWILNTPPRSVMASGGVDYYRDGREWHDNVVAIYEYATTAGVVRGTYQVYNTTSHGGFFETFMGDEGSMVVSEDTRKGYFFKEVHAKMREWEDESETVTAMGTEAFELKIGETLAPDGSKDPEGQRLLAESQKPVHQLHLENFFKAIAGHAELNCPPQIGYETAVCVLRVNEAIEMGRRLDFAADEFEV